MYVSSNIVARWRHHFSTKTEKCIFVELHFIANYIKILSVEQQC